MSPESTIYSRSVYTVWDWLGDLGGLYGTLYLMGSYIVKLTSYIAGDSLTLQLIENLYKFEAPTKRRDNRDISKWITHRRPAKLSYCTWLRCFQNRKTVGLQKVAEDQITKELDIVTFLKHQMIDKIERRLIFSRMDRYLMRHQYNPFVLEKQSKLKSGQTESYDSSECPIELTPNVSTGYNRLLL